MNNELYKLSIQFINIFTLKGSWKDARMDMVSNMNLTYHENFCYEIWSIFIANHKICIYTVIAGVCNIY